MLRFGKICGIDPALCRVRVEFPEDGITSHWLPVLVPGTAGVQYFRIFQANEHVACLMDENLVNGVCLGSIYDAGNKPAGKEAQMVSIDFPGGSKVEFDQDTDTFVLTAGGQSTFTISPAGFDFSRNGENLRSILEEIVNANIAETHNVTAVGAPSGPPINLAQYNAILTRLANLFE